LFTHIRSDATADFMILSQSASEPIAFTAAIRPMRLFFFQIDLSGNQITEWPSENLLVTSTVPNGGLIVANNPINCDCKIYSLRGELQRILLSYSFDQTVCSSPAAAAGQRVLCLNPRSIGCHNNMSACDYEPLKVCTDVYSGVNSRERTCFISN
jgi:hypothetical protein